MKNILSFIVCACFITGTALFANAQTKFTEGKIIFDITFPDMDLDQNMMAMMPSDMTMYVKNGMSRGETKMGMGTVVAINKNDSTIMLMDMMGRKMVMKMGKEDTNKAKEKVGKPEVKMTGETKDIAGYKCAKATVTMDIKDGKQNGPYTFDVWYTKDIQAKNSSKNQIEGIDWFMMEFQTKEQGMTMKMTARSVEPQAVPDSLFVVPDGYEEMKMDDLRKMGGRER